MAANDCWGAFGSDSEDDDGATENDGVGDRRARPAFEPAADATALAITRHFATLARSTGVQLKERVVGIAIDGECDDGDGSAEELRGILSDRVGARGMKAVHARDENGGDFVCDAAILLGRRNGGNSANSSSSCVKRALLPGGHVWLVFSREGTVVPSDEIMDQCFYRPEGYSEAVWGVASSATYRSSDFEVISLHKRAMTCNDWSCPWMDKNEKINAQLPALSQSDGFPIASNDTYLDYERRVMSSVTISPSVAERGNPKELGGLVTVLTDANVKRAAHILRDHGLVIIKGLLPPSQTIPWGEAVLSDFESAVTRLKRHPTRPVDLLHPRVGSADDGDGSTPTSFEPLSYREMAMREDLRVDLRSGPAMEALRRSQNSFAYPEQKVVCVANSAVNDIYVGPTMIDSDFAGTTQSWRFHPSLLAIIKATFNPRDDKLYRGNFGRWNFGGAGPDGSPQHFRLGQVGSVLSCPGSGDQAVHADTPHLFEHTDCLPCHYLNVFTPGYQVTNDPSNNHSKHEFDDDGIWKGNSSMGGTAFVHGSHKLSITTQLLHEEVGDDNNANEDKRADSALHRRLLLQLRTLRPALDAGDVLIFDCRTIHFGLANTSEGDTSGENMNAGRRPMLYLNVSQSWFHDPKNWDDRERIFD